ncbi:hypothetical protein AVEN_83871-1 [Araneus ventricosus]|uniref:Uncharacterized protein n=1 Tax=Araneus ventricosus TaxID=182803 RepID=A0A4Y2FU07_ARAVE|nr:hypothetical protein AVEN_83871-1 [Araneus ventricosus]
MLTSADLEEKEKKIRIRSRNAEMQPARKIQRKGNLTETLYSDSWIEMALGLFFMGLSQVFILFSLWVEGTGKLRHIVLCMPSCAKRLSKGYEPNLGFDKIIAHEDTRLGSFSHD